VGASFYWYDYETFGMHPGLDRPAQFAGVRTDTNLEPLDEELLIFNRLSDDYLPQPEACRVTGIGPHTVQQHGLPEYEFIRRIHAELATPETCLIGYNSIRFDDEFTRFTLFRNFYDPYEHEWKHGNSRWDLLDVVRLTRALRPAGINWPSHADGKPSNRLEDLTAANGIDHVNAHDALADVHATIAVAKMIRSAQPKLFDYALNHRGKAAANAALNLRERKAVVHISGMLPGEHGHAAIIAPVARLPGNKNAVVVFDLRYDPAELAELEADAIRERVFTPGSARQAGVTRLPLKTVHVNRCPVLVPLSVLDDASAERLQLNKTVALKHLLTLQQLNIEERVATAMQAREHTDIIDVDASLYSGGFFSDADRRTFARIRAEPGDALKSFTAHFDDPRIDEMLFRYRARNWPDSLDADEKRRWHEHRRLYLQTLLNIERNAGCAEQTRLQQYFRTVQELDWRPEQAALRKELLEWGHTLEIELQGAAGDSRSTQPPT